MPNEIYVFHPGVGQKEDGASSPLVVTKSGTNFVFIEQDFSPDLTSTAFFHGAVVPPEVSVAGNATFRLTLRQDTAGAGAQVEFDVLYGLLEHPQPPTPYVPAPPNRDIPLTSIGSINVPVPGAVGLEVSVEFTVPIAAFTAGKEVLLGVQRVIGGTDTFVGGTMALVRLDTDFPVDGGAVIYQNANNIYQAHGGIGVGWSFPAPGKTVQEMLDYILYPFRTPTIDSFTLTALAPDPIPGIVPATLEVGNTIPPYVPPPPLPPALTPPNSIKFDWTTTDLNVPAVILPNTIQIEQVALPPPLGTLLPNSGTATLQLNPADDPVLVNAAAMPVGPVPVTGQNRVQKSFRISCDYNEPLEPGGPVVQTMTRDSVFSWYWYLYYGISAYDTLREVELTGTSWTGPSPYLVGDEVEDVATGLKTGVVSWVDGGDDKHIKVVMHQGSADFVNGDSLLDSATGSIVLNVIAGVSFPDDLIENLVGSLLTGNVNRTYVFGATGYKYLCYPTSFNYATFWNDSLTGFNVPFVNLPDILVTNQFNEGIGYKVQRSLNIIGAAINIIVA